MVCKHVNKVKLFQVLLCITNSSIKHQSFVYTQLNDQTVLFQTIQFSMSFVCTQFKCQTILYNLLIGATILGKSGSASNSNERVFCIPHSSSITSTSPSDCLMYSYGPPHMAGQKQDDQLKHTSSSYVRILVVALKTCQRQWTIGRSGERESGISVPTAQHDDDDDDDPSAEMQSVYFYSPSRLGWIGLGVRKNYTKKINLNVQWMQQNNPRLVDKLLKSINQ